MLLLRLARTAQIDHGIRFANQLMTSGLRHPDIVLGDRIAKAPSIAETETIEDAADELEITRRIRSKGLCDRIVDIRAVIFDVVNVEAELAESDQMMEQLPHDARERVSHREMQNDNSAFAFHPESACDSSYAARLRIAL